MRLRVNVCPDCFRKIERSPLAYCRRILKACPKCSKHVAPALKKPRVAEVFAASVLADTLRGFQR